MLMDFVTDRTEADVLLGNENGRYGYQDLNRVEKAVEELCRLAVQADICLDLTTKTDWKIPGTFSIATWPTERQMERYLQNVKALCDCFELKAALPSNMSQLDYRGANAIERALEQVYNRINAILAAFQYSGDYYAGEENYL